MSCRAVREAGGPVLLALAVLRIAAAVALLIALCWLDAMSMAADWAAQRCDDLLWRLK